MCRFIYLSYYFDALTHILVEWGTYVTRHKTKMSKRCGCAQFATARFSLQVLNQRGIQATSGMVW